MSSFYILGFFQLKAGRRVAVTKPNSNFPTHYAHYSTNVWCLDNTTIPADIRVFTASTTPLVPDGMVAFAVCTAQSTATPPTANSLASNALALDALMFVVLPGNPESDTYNDHLPDEFTSMAYGVGRVSGSPQTLNDGHASRLITVALSDFVRGETKASTVQCVFDLSTARWTRAPTPQANTVMQFYGLCRDLSPEGILRIKVDSTALNIGSNASTASDNTQTSTNAASAPTSPSKRRKFDPPSPPSNPGPLLSASTSTSASPPSLINNSTPIDPFTTAPAMPYAQFFPQFSQYLPGATSAFMPPFVPQQNSNSYPTAAYSPYQLPFPPYAPFNSKGEFAPSSADVRNAPPSFISNPRNVTASESSIPTSLAQEDSAFNRSAANPYNYPMTQM
ncbi:hypothetical protein DFH08DRAFT_704617 [Mycena albidolilacea]|uniref:Uncharacterized protein n=1 Tax=Mycena albidolilacea TaxID=1033008 RepID=A0AAD6ZUX6_9AGAR|nr:hypothetical protein DFH08DRAFT_704617 [Mycena albidolilacea]